MGGHCSRAPGPGLARKAFPAPSVPAVQAALAALVALAVGLALPAFLLLGDIELVAHDLSAYRASFVETGAPARTGLTEDQLVWVISRTVDYATGRRADLQFDRADLDGGPPGRPAFTPDEVKHMADVRLLFGLARTWRRALLGAALTGTVALLLLDRRRAGVRLARGLVAGATLALASWALLAVAVLVGFGPFWTAFHETLFTNDLWLLPESSLLIRMLPESLFQSLALEVVGLFSLETVLILVAAVIYLRRVAEAARVCQTACRSEDV